MNDVLARAAKTLNPLIAAIITIAAAIAGGALGNGPLGVILGLAAGAAVAIALCGSVALLAAIEERLAAPLAASHTSAHVSGPAVKALGPAVPAYASRGHAMNGQAAVNGASAPTHAAAISPAETVIVESTVPVAAGIEAVSTQVTASEAQLMAEGRFAAYHLAKAKRLFNAGDLKEAAYQAGASLSHDVSAEAAALRKAALAGVR